MSHDQIFHRECNDGSNDGHSHHSRLLTRKVSDNNPHHQSTSDSNDTSSLVVIHIPKPLSNRISLDASYDTDDALGTSGNRHNHHHHHSSNNYEYLISPRLSVSKHEGQLSKSVATVSFQQRLSHKMHI